MKVLNGIKQGSEEWLALRRKYRTASEAPAMMGVGKISRNELLASKADGVDKEHAQYVEDVIFARGHEIEALARPMAEALMGQELYPVTGVDDDDYLLASFDGMTMDESLIWECKQWNEAKAEAVREHRVPEEDVWQVVHQLRVSGARKCLYTVTDGTEQRTVHTWVEPNARYFDRLLNGWRQFDEDLANYTPREVEAEVVGRAPDQLPSLRIEVAGMVKSSNLEQFREQALAVFRSIKTDLATDEDFANAEKTVKWCKDVEKRLDGAKEQALAQTASIDELFRAIDAIRDESRNTRLELEKSVKARKESIRREIVAEATQSLMAHVSKINESLDIPIRAPEADFAGAIKGKRTVSSLRDAADTCLAQAKIAANETADLVRANLQLLGEVDSDYRHLFADRHDLVARDTEWLRGVIKTRIVEFKEAEAKRLEAERARIRQEEEAKARRAAEQAAKADEAAASAPTVAPQPHQSEPPAAPARPQRETSAPRRPSDAQIIEVLALHYRVHESKVIEWLLDMDLEVAGEKMVANL